jgi:L-Ala-D/L-Glu epimerase
VLITSMEWRGIRVPFKSPDAVRNRTPLGRHTMLLWIGTDTGMTGVGEVPPRGPGNPEDITYLARLFHELAPSALGMDPALAMDILSAIAPRTSLGDIFRFGLETATYDLIGQQVLRPVADMLGGVIDWVPMNAIIDFAQPDEAARLATEAVDQGYACVKLSLGARNPDTDVEVVRQVRAAIGANVALRADADERWTTEGAIRILKRLEPYGLEYVQQPVIAEDLTGMAKIRKHSPVSIAADESVGTPDEAQRVMDAEAADVLVVKPARAGGIRATYAIMEMARERGLQTIITSSLETGVGIAAGLHLASALGPARASGLASGSLLTHDLLETALVPVRGHITVPQTPGLGVRLEMDMVDRYTTDVMGVVAG